MTPDDHALLTRYRLETERILAEAIGRDRDVALLDVPNQLNVGDTLILLGELDYLRRIGARIRYMADLRSYRPDVLRRLLPAGGVVLLHGGGNFGDLWPGHQDHRERVVAELHDHRIVQLPQSVKFVAGERAAQADRIIGAHPDLLVLLRDEPSMLRAAEELPRVATRFCYDLALGCTPRSRAGARVDATELLVLARADHEGVSGLRSTPSGWLPGRRAVVADWGYDGLPLRRRLLRALTRVHHRWCRAVGSAGAPADRVVNALFRRLIVRLNAENAAMGLRIYRSAGSVLTDRLHAHVLAVLLGIDHVLLDNSYGKLSSIYDGYTGAFSTARFATDPDAAKALLAEAAAR